MRMRIEVEPGEELLTAHVTLTSAEVVMIDRDVALTFDPTHAVRGLATGETAIDLCADGMAPGARTMLTVGIVNGSGASIARYDEAMVVMCEGDLCSTACTGP